MPQARARTVERLQHHPAALDRSDAGGDDLEGQGLKRVAGEDRGRFIEGLVAGGPATTQVVVVHRGKIVVDQRERVDEFHRAGEGQGPLAAFSPADGMRGGEGRAGAEPAFRPRRSSSAWPRARARASATPGAGSDPGRGRSATSVRRAGWIQGLWSSNQRGGSALGARSRTRARVLGENFDLRLRLLEPLLTEPGAGDAFLVELEGLFEGEIALLERAHDLLETGQRRLERFLCFLRFGPRSGNLLFPSVTVVRSRPLDSGPRPRRPAITSLALKQNTPLRGGGESVAAAQNRERREGIEPRHGCQETASGAVERRPHPASQDEEPRPRDHGTGRRGEARRRRAGLSSRRSATARARRRSICDATRARIDSSARSTRAWARPNTSRGAWASQRVARSRNVETPLRLASIDGHAGAGEGRGDAAAQPFELRSLAFHHAMGRNRVEPRRHRSRLASRARWSAALAFSVRSAAWRWMSTTMPAATEGVAARTSATKSGHREVRLVPDRGDHGRPRGDDGPGHRPPR